MLLERRLNVKKNLCADVFLVLNNFRVHLVVATERRWGRVHQQRMYMCRHSTGPPSRPAAELCVFYDVSCGGACVSCGGACVSYGGVCVSYGGACVSCDDECVSCGGDGGANDADVDLNVF